MRNINYNEVKRGEALGLIMRNCVVLLLLFYYLRHEDVHVILFVCILLSEAEDMCSVFT